MASARWSSLVLILAALGSALPSQEEAPVVVPCRKCKDQGEVSCKKHGRGVDELEVGVLCSVAAACPSCEGAMATDCSHCENPVVEAAMQKRREMAQAFAAAEKARVDAVVGHDGLLHLRTDHVDLAFSLAPMKVERATFDTHRLMHLYGERIEALRADFMAVMGLDEGAFSTRLMIFLLEDRDDHRLIAPKFCGAGANGIAQKLMGVDAVYSFYRDPKLFRTDEQVHRNVVHATAHLLLANMAPAVWIGNRGHGWLDAGVAHWFEDRVTGACTNFCYEEVGITADLGFGKGRWRVPVRQLVEAGKARSFAALSSLNTDQLEMADHGLSFAYVDYLIDRGGGPTFAAFLRAIKGGAKTQEAVRQHYDVSVLAIDEAFVEWVREHYPAK